MTVSYTSVEIHSLLAARLEWGAVTEEAALTAFPLIPVGEDLWATSFGLIADSLAPFMLEAIRLESQWETAIAQPFEDEVNDFLRLRGFASGPVSANGHWDARGPGADTLRAAINRQLAASTGSSPLTGQVDVLAMGRHGCFVIECKSLSAMIKPTNTFGRLSPIDAESWRSKLASKIAWLQPRLGRIIDLGVVTVEGLQYLHSAEETADIPVMPFDLLKSTIDEGLAQYTG
ncbi:hypothetical protein [Mycolicibacterium phocaicum]|uniref:hypothetical protein n=1 Tax=Mycolicibacterium phocaicum TaxID=319706 RepID=UPI001CF996D3|nr:hypothetical protein [Mycolicibacterium phocaicum]UCZ63255.1 hypothetical protein LHJ73_14360 [Mycolicibacterium phocaicum]